ncbi:MAG TPA: methionine gamma-lyase [Erysipelotrichaceae bacterium]|jgi:methionine-gamma-lyase|nr:methionine gamma-lyase [Erysipelotrichaceae bacterium]
MLFYYNDLASYFGRKKMSRYDTDFNKMGFGTRAVRSGEHPDERTHALNTPIFESSTFAYETAEEYDEMLERGAGWEEGLYIYSRTTNPTTDELAMKIRALEHSEDALIVSCGMAAVSCALLGNLNAGDHVICSDDTFMCTSSMFEDVLPSKGIETSRVEILDLDQLEAAFRPNTKVVYLEVESNPQLKLANLPEIAKIAHAHGCKFIVDNTFLSPNVLTPLDWGVDIVVHSGTKYLVGHGDALCGVMAGSKKDMDRARYIMDNLGQHISPFDAWLALRGIHTLHVRNDRQCETAMKLANWFEQRPEVAEVLYPGLESHPQHELAKKMFRGERYGGMLGVRLKGGYEAMCRFCDATKIPPVATSLGDVVTLMFPKSHYNNLIRLSIGLEDADDLIADFDQAFEALKD